MKKELTEKQQQILRVAENLFASRGFDGTSVRDIAEAADINTAMISYYFGSKEKLMEAIFEYRSSSIKMKVESLLQNDTISPEEKINVLIDDHIDAAMQKQQFYKLMLCERVINKNPFIIHLMDELKRRSSNIISALIKDGQEKGVFKKDVDVLLLLNTMSGTLMQTLIAEDFFKSYHNMEHMPHEQFQKKLKQKLGNHIKTLFKAILTHEV